MALCEVRSIPRLTAALLTSGAADLIVIDAVPVVVVVIIAAFARASLETVNWNPDSFPLISDRENVAVDAAIAAYAAAHPTHIVISLVDGESLGRDLG